MAENSEPGIKEKLLDGRLDRYPRQELWEEAAAEYFNFIKEYAPNVATFIPDFLNQYEKENQDVEISRDGYLIDVGCGPGNSANAMRELFGFKGRIDGIDGSPKMKNLSLKTYPNLFTEYYVKFIERDSEIPLQENFYDLAISVASFGARTIENVMIIEFFKFLKPGGYFAIIAPEMAVKVPYEGKQPAIADLIEQWEKEDRIRLVYKKEYPNYWREATGIALLLQRMA